MNKVYDGTPHGNRSICATCRFAQNIRGIQMQQDSFCLRLGSMPVRIGYPVEQCNGYEDKRTPSIYDMQQIAWSVTSRQRGPVGFQDADRNDLSITPPDDASRNAPPPPRPITG